MNIVKKYNIHIDNLVVKASIGILEHELLNKQDLHIDAKLSVKSNIDESDDIESVLDYRAIRDTITQLCTEKHTNLIETLVNQIGHKLLEQFPEIYKAYIKVSKPEAFNDCDSVGISIKLKR